MTKGTPEPLRVVHVATHLPARRRGGVETYVGQLVEQQRAAGLAPRLLGTHDGEGVVAPQADAIEVPSLPLLQLLHSMNVGAWQRADLRTALRQLDADVVHVHHWHQLGVEVVRAARACGLPVVVTLHDYFAVCPMFFRLRGTDWCASDVEAATCVACIAEATSLPAAQIAEPFAAWSAEMLAELRAADRVLALSRAQAEQLARIPRLAGLPIEVVDLAPPATGAPVALRSDDAAVAAGALRVATWGGLVPGKGLELLLEACARLAFAAEVHHFGAMPDADYAARLRQGASVPLTLHGSFAASDDTQRPRLACDLAVFPSYFAETYGLAVDEAMLAGLPVVVGDRGAPHERVGERGLVCRVGDAADLADKIALARSRLASLRAGAPAFRSTATQHCDRLTEIYRRLVTARRDAASG